MRLDIRDFDIFIKITRRKIHIIKNHKIWIKIRGEINKKKLDRKSDREESETKIQNKIDLIHDSKLKSNVIR